MYWSVQTSDVLAALRTLILNGGWDRYWRHRQVLPLGLLNPRLIRANKNRQVAFVPHLGALCDADEQRADDRTLDTIVRLHERANLSSASIVVHATGLTRQDTTASGVLDDSSNANPDNEFRYDATLGGTGGYVYNLSTRNLSTGTGS